MLTTDGSDNPVGGDTITFFADGGVFQGGQTIYTTELDPNGEASVKVTSGSAGRVQVHAQAANTSDTISISYSTQRLTLSASPKLVMSGGGESTTITAVYRTGTGAPVNGAWIRFATNAGTLTSDSAQTVNGKAKTKLKSGDFAGVATVQAVAPEGNATVEVGFVSDVAAHVTLTVSPDNVGTNGGVATLTATVVDSNGNMVSGAPVNFKILKGPGGDEYIENPLVASNNGVARSELVAGSQPSQYRGVEVAAYVGNSGDTSKLTISGPPHIITISRPEDDTVEVPEGGVRDQSTFEYYIGAVVQDINGNPVADNTEVHFSAVVSGMSVARLVLDHWAGIESADEEIKAVLAYRLRDIPFEDINNNMRMDPGIDLRLDFGDDVAARGDDVNGDGVCDYNPAVHDFFWDFNGNGVCDTDVGEPVYLMDYQTGIGNIDTLVDTTIKIADRSIIGYDTSEVVGSDTMIINDTAITVGTDTTIIRDTAITVGQDTTIIEDTTIVVRNDTTVINDTTIELVYIVEQGTDTTVSLVYDTVQRIDTTIYAREDTVFARYDTVSAGSAVCDTTKDTTSGGTVYLVYCYNDSVFAVYELVATNDTSIEVVTDTVGVASDTTYEVAYDTLGTEYDTTVTVRYDVTPVRDTTTTVEYVFTPVRDTAITTRYQFEPVRDTSITVRYQVIGVRDTIIEPRYTTNKVIDTTVTVTYDTTFIKVDSTGVIYADLNQNGQRDHSELTVDHDGDEECDLPASGDFRFSLWEMRRYWRGDRFDFDTNDFAVVIDVSAPTEGGVARTTLTYPRQMARRLYATVNAETKGVRDKNGERFLLPLIVE